MRLIGKIPAENNERKESLMREGWQPLKESKRMAVVIGAALPISILLFFICGKWLYFLFPEFQEALQFEKIIFRIDLKLILYMLGIYGYILLHEIIHLLTIPNALSSDKTFFGINGFFGFVYSEEILTKARFIIVSIMPLLQLSFVMPILFKVLNIYHGYWMMLFMINAAGACVDIFNMILVGWQVPSRGLVVGNGLATYYKATA
ncbi:MAG: DUF3267 domain-containing protein [Peptostreptococcaceae bacterium]|nr:DUF3267 domain-containing protein [Peptostreptococcaceae bacterium]